MSKYQRGKIYKLVSSVTGDVYYGSTIEPRLTRRLVKHRASYKYYKKGKGEYMTSHKIIETNDYYISLVENVPCESKDELLQRERYYIDNNKCVNKAKPIAGKEEKRQNTSVYKKKYYKLHKEDLKTKKSTSINCACGVSYRYSHKRRHLASMKHHILLLWQE